ncbi:MAG TPA: hypothetical protein GX506_07040 [Firmicutes bacterium]|nr:hypothetical protein [Bacillota bacterium]
MAGEDKSLYGLLDELILNQGKEPLNGGELLAVLSLLNLLGILDFMRLQVSTGAMSTVAVTPGAAGSAMDAKTNTTGPGQGPTPDIFSVIANVANQMGLGNKVNPAMVQAIANLMASQMGSAGSRKSERPATPEKPALLTKPAAEAEQPKGEQKQDAGQGSKPDTAEEGNLDWRRQWKKA